MVVAIIRVDKQRGGIDVAFTCSFNATVLRLALVQIAVGIAPEDTVAYIRLCFVIGSDAVFVMHKRYIADCR